MFLNYITIFFQDVWWSKVSEVPSFQLSKIHISKFISFYIFHRIFLCFPIVRLVPIATPNWAQWSKSRALTMRISWRPSDRSWPLSVCGSSAWSFDPAPRPLSLSPLARTLWSHSSRTARHRRTLPACWLLCAFVSIYCIFLNRIPLFIFSRKIERVFVTHLLYIYIFHKLLIQNWNCLVALICLPARLRISRRLLLPNNLEVLVLVFNWESNIQSLESK